MGIAKVNEETCLAHQGNGFKGKPRGNSFEGIYRSPNSKTGKPAPLSETTFDREICDLCVTECPIGETAIIMSSDGKTGRITPQVLAGCTGCGVCVMVCPTQKESIIIEPIKEESHV
jgi:ferredoxin-type protein NapG